MVTSRQKISKIEISHHLDLLASAKLRLDIMVEELAKRKTTYQKEKLYFTERLTRCADEMLYHHEALENL